MLLTFYIISIVYMPILLQVIPKIETLGIGYYWLPYYFLILIFIFEYIRLRISPFLNKWTLIVVIFHIVFIASIGWSDVYKYDMQTINVVFRNGMLPILVIVMAQYIFREEKSVQAFAKYLNHAVSVIAVISIYQFFTAGSAPSSIDTEGTRVSGIFSNANDLAIFLVLSLPCLLYGIRKKLLPSWMHYITLSIVILGIGFTVSRKGMISMFLVFIMFYFIHKDYKKVLAILCCLAIVYLAVFLGSNIIPKRLTEKRLTMELRGKSTLRDAGIKLFLEKPITGFGYKGYYEHAHKYLRDAITVKRYDAHNMYVTEVVDRGLIGFIPFILIFLYPLFISARILFKSRSQKQWSHQSDTAVICVCAVIPFMINGFFAGGMFMDVVTLFLLLTQVSFLFASLYKTKPTEQMSYNPAEVRMV